MADQSDSSASSRKPGSDGLSRGGRSAADAPPVSAVLLTYNAMARIDACLRSLIDQSLPFDEIVVVDNASTDGTPDYIEANYPAARVERFDTNNGCSGGRNRQVDAGKNEHVFIIDDDVLLTPDCHRELAGVMQAHPDAALWSPRVVYEQKRDTLQFDGQSLHYLGEAVMVRGDVPLTSDLPTDPFPITVQHGVAFIVHRPAAQAVGGFDASFFFGKTDGDFSYRLSLAGYSILSVPRAVVYHRVKERGIRQTHRQIRNRWVMMIKSYKLSTFVALLPAMLVYELLLLGFMASKGGIGQYLAGNLAVFKDLQETMRKRKHMQAVRKVRDRDLLSGGSMHIRKDLIGNPLVRLAFQGFDAFTRLYWKLIRPLIR